MRPFWRLRINEDNIKRDLKNSEVVERIKMVLGKVWLQKLLNIKRF
jgi:hypothetical protein